MKPRDPECFKKVRKAALDALAKRRPWEQEWQNIADVISPYSVQIIGRRSVNKAQRQDRDIVNGSPQKSLNDMSAGFMARITSPARRWFGLQVTSGGAAKADLDVDARSYLDAVSEIISSDFQRGGWYATLSMSTYRDMGGPGTAAVFMDEQPDGSVVFVGVPVGRFAIDVDHLDRVNKWVREWSATAPQLRDRFAKKNLPGVPGSTSGNGIEELPERVRNALARDDSNTEFDVLHCVVPCEKTPQGFAFSSTWWLQGDSTDVLHEGGYYEFPALVPRWTARPGDIYGRGPGWDAQGDIRTLQHYSRGLIELIDAKLNPPKWSTNATPFGYLPGTTTHIESAPGAKVEAGDVVTVTAQDIEIVQATVDRYEQKIDGYFYGALWRSFTGEERSNITATEVEARKQELALLAGPLLESLNGELLEPAIERRYNMLARRGVLPPLPESLQGQEIRVEFISIMHQMQQATTLLGVRSFLMDATNLANIRPEVIDMINGDAVLEEMARASGVSADTLISKEELAKVRAMKAQQHQQQMQTEQALAFTQGIHNVKGTDPKQLSELAGTLSPAAAAQGGAV